MFGLKQGFRYYDSLLKPVFVNLEGDFSNGILLLTDFMFQISEP